MQTFKCTPEDAKFILKTKNYEAAQNIRCINCRDLWKNHFAGKSQSIPQGACLVDLDVIYSG